jgi:hypothetical protein|nr:MAG TPA: hypothetical protein [Caudoviricetes sp.]
MSKKRFRLYDIYDVPDCREKIGEFDTMDEVQRAARRWDVEETDGECAFALYELHEDDGKYHRVHDWSY